MNKDKEIFYKTLITYVKEKYADDDTLSFLLEKINSIDEVVEEVVKDEPEENMATFLKKRNINPELAARIARLDESLKRSVEIIKRMDSTDKKNNYSNKDGLLDIINNIVDSPKLNLNESKSDNTSFINKSQKILERADELFFPKIASQDAINNVENTNTPIELKVTNYDLDTINGPWVGSELLSGVNVTVIDENENVE